ncbi:MAG: 30S ribosomal protein S6 [Chitinivibrionia bacterium]|nr:30S ribosomal protein S6 [Chitinivibrionia bacterium]
MSKYETIVVFDGNLPSDTIEKERKKVEELLSANGSIVKIDEWGKKYLAYPVKKKTTGFYVLFIYEYKGNAGNFIENNFKFNENIIRYLTVIHENSPIFAETKTGSDRANDNLDDDEEEEE